MTKEKLAFIVGFIVTLVMGNSTQATAGKQIKRLEVKVINNIALAEDTCKNGIDNMSVIRFKGTKRTKVMHCKHNGQVGDTLFFEVNRRNHDSAYYM